MGRYGGAIASLLLGGMLYAQAPGTDPTLDRYMREQMLNPRRVIVTNNPRPFLDAWVDVDVNRDGKDEMIAITHEASQKVNISNLKSKEQTYNYCLNVITNGKPQSDSACDDAESYQLWILRSPMSKEERKKAKDERKKGSLPSPTTIDEIVNDDIDDVVVGINDKFYLLVYIDDKYKFYSFDHTKFKNKLDRKYKVGSARAPWE